MNKHIDKRSENRKCLEQFPKFHSLKLSFFLNYPFEVYYKEDEDSYKKRILKIIIIIIIII